VSYNAAIIQYALNHFPDEHRSLRASASGPRYYRDEIYRQLGLQAA
jgi:hypothetical protein